MFSLEWLEQSLAYLPWLIFAIILSPTLFLAYFGRIYPTYRWMFVLVPITLLLIAGIIFSLFQDAENGKWLFSFIARTMVVVDAVAIVLLAIDLLSVIRRSQIRVERSMMRVASLAKSHEVTLQLSNMSQRSWTIDIRDDQPDGLYPEPAEQRLTLPASKRAVLTYQLRAHRRGEFLFEKTFLRLHSRFGFWVRDTFKEVPGTLHVYPDMKQLAEYAILARTNRLSLIGVRRTRKVGQDNNFERLRDYNDGDNYKHIDWRSTARRQKITVKQFQSDHSQRIVFMVDCGRMMTNEFQGLNLVDYALNSMLMLSYVALQQRDSVGLLCFSDRVHDYVPLASGRSHMNRLLHASFDRFPTMVQSRFDSAFLHFSGQCRRRSMVVLITNVIDEVSANQITNYLSNLSGRHLPVLALLRDHRMFDYADYPDIDDTVLYRSAAAAQILVWRNEVIRRVQRQGVLVVDAFPEQLTSPLVNQYLEAKAKHLL
jgi:uncharacterized protein (DUF58 family)